MKSKLTLFLLPVSMLLSAQTIDSVALQQVDSLITASRSLTEEQDFTGAYAANEQAEKITLDKFGKESIAWGNTCFNHGRICYFEGRYAEAEPWYLASKAIRERLLGKNDPEYAKSLNNLAIVYEEMSQYELAEPLYLEAMSIREKLLGKENASYANALSNLAGLYMVLGAYEKSEWMNLEAKDIRERVLGKSHADYAASLHNLANLYLEMGRYDKAEPLYLESKEIWQAAGSDGILDYALCLDNLGQVYQLMGRFEKSEQLYAEALKLDEKTLGREHSNYILGLSHLGSLYKDMGQYGKAEALYLEALALSGKAMGEANLDQATNLYRIAELYLKTGEYKKAIPLAVDAIKLFEEKLGKSNVLTITGMGLLAKLYSATGNIASAMPIYIEASQANKDLLRQASHYLSERELMAFSQKFDEQLSRDFSFAQVAPAIVPTCYDDILFYKGFLLSAVQQVSKLTTKDPVAAEQYNRFKSYHRLLAEEYAKPAEERSNVAELETAANNLEKELVRTVKGLGPVIRQVGWEEVQSALGQGEAAIEFVHYQYLAPQPTAITNYVALVLLPGAKAPYFVPLFEEKQLSALLPKRNETGKLPAEALNRLYAANTSQLYALLWKPLEQYLAGVNTIYFSPTGLLHQLDIPAIGLPGGQGTVLADRYAMVDLGSTRQLAAPKAEAVAGLEVNGQHRFSGQEALLFGGIDYDLDSTAIAQRSPVPSDEADAELSLRNRGLQLDWMDSTDRGNTWSALPWTEVEVVALAQILKEQRLKPTLLQRNAATEEALKRRSGQAPFIIHLATHGYFFPAPKKAEAQLNLEAGQVIKTSALPMIRSGLILAGGNYAWKEGKPAKPGMEDGILTAYEISQMDMASTELVVLSACETGLGDIQGNEGVYGLQRAFKIAGAKYIIMSLWQVPDYQTQQLMSSFYDFWLQGKLPIPDAFRSAQKAMREKFADPFYWAGFLLVQ